MAIDVNLPSLDKLMETGTIVQWLKADGEKVEKGQPLALIETEKVTAEVEAPESGVLKVIEPAGSTVAVGVVIGQIFPLGTSVAEAKPAAKPPQAVEAPKAVVQAAVEKKEAAPIVEEGRVRAMPAAKRLARERGVDLSKVKGTGPDGVITQDDVASFLKTVQVSAPSAAVKVEGEEEVIPVVGWRKTMAERMAQSKHTAAHITTVAEVDVSELAALRDKILPVIEEKSKLKITYTPFIVKAVAQSLQEFPIVNSSMVGDKIVVKKHSNIGIAIARPEGGLIVPVVHNAEKMNIIEIGKKIEELNENAKAGKLGMEDLRDGTFTITNVGMMGVIFNTPIINPPESAILGVGAIVKRPVVVDDQIVIRHRMYLALSYDHRVIDGAPAIRCLQRVRQLLENPHSLLPF